MFWAKRTSDQRTKPAQAGKDAEFDLTISTKLSFEDAFDLVLSGARQEEVDQLLGTPKYVEDKQGKQIRSYSVLPNSPNTTELFTGIFEAGRVIRVRRTVLAGNP